MKYNIVSDILIEHEIEANSEQEALDKHANEVELPSGYIQGTWELESIEEIK